MKSFGERLQELRKEYDLNQVELAKRIGVSKVSISKYESGTIMPSLETMLKIKQEFGKSLDWQMGFDDNLCDKYSKIIDECEKSEIPPEKVQEIIHILKK